MLKQKIIIAVFKKHDVAKDKWSVVGYRFFDLQRKEIEDFNVKDKNFISYLIKHKDNIENGTWDINKGNAKIKFINGNEQRYPVLNADNGQLVGTNPLVIAAEFRDGYLVVGPFGETFEWTKEQAVAYARLNGIANGSYKQKGNRGFISAISGNYSFIDRNIITPEMVAKKKALDRAKKLKESNMKQEVKEPVKKDVKSKDDKVKENVSNILQNDIVKEPEKDVKEIEDVSKIKNNNINREEDPIAKSIMDEAVEEKAEDGLTYEEIKEALSDIPVPYKTQKFDDDFYKQLEPTFGGKKSVDILKYMIEERNYSIDAVYKLIEEGKEVNKYVPTLIGLLTIYTDSVYRKTDNKLYELCKKAIDPSVLEIEKDLINRGIEFNEVWDADIVAPVREHDTRKYAFPLSLLEERIANYIAYSGSELYNCSIEKDGTTWYNGVEVKVPGYRISGVNPKYITITSSDGKTKKVSASKRK